MRATYVLEGTITAVQPLSTCSLALKESQDRRFGKGKSPMPVPEIQTANGTRLMFPATGIRGKLRRAMRDVLRDSVIERTGNLKPLTLDQHYLLTLGGIKASDSVDKSTVALDAVWREKNPLLSLFGAGDAGVLGFMQGRLSVGNAICKSVSEPVVFSGARTDDLYRNKEQINFLSGADVESLIQRSEGNRTRASISGVITAKEKAYKTAKKANDASADVLKAELDAMKAELDTFLTDTGTKSVSLGMPLNGWQAIPVQSEMDHTMIIAGGTLIELGALLSCLEQFSLLPILGSHFASGCGQISASYELFSVVRGQGKISQGLITMAPFSGALAINAGPESAIYEAKRQFAEYLAGDELDLSIPSV